MKNKILCTVLLFLSSCASVQLKEVSAEHELVLQVILEKCEAEIYERVCDPFLIEDLEASVQQAKALRIAADPRSTKDSH